MLEARVLLAANVIVAPASYEFRDMGFDPVTQDVGIVGSIVEGDTRTATLFELNAAQEAFVTQTLVGLGPGTQVFGIASDASRIAGVSKSPGSISIGEGTTWIRQAPGSPAGIGYASASFGFSTSSVGVGAWSDGVVGSAGGAQGAFKWDRSTGLSVLAGHEDGLAEAKDVSADGSVIVGFSTHEIFNGAAYYWDDAGIHRLADNIPGSTLYQSVAYSISPSGNYIGGIVSTEESNIPFAAVWDSSRNLVPIKDAAGNLFGGGVVDVSNHGYAVGTTSDGRGFIWHPSFDGVQSPFVGAQIFDDWLAAIPGGITLPFASRGIEAIAEDLAEGQLLFCLSDYEAPGASAFVEVDVPELRVSGFSNGLLVVQTDDASLEVRSSGGLVEVLRNGVLDASLSDIPAASVTALRVNGGAARNVIDLSGVTRTAFPASGGVTVFVEAGAGHDAVIGSEFADQLSGGEGNDALLGGAGNDTLRGGAGNDLLNGQTQHDVLFGESGKDRLLGGLGNDVLDGGDGHDRLEGQGGLDALSGGNHNDTLQGGTGDDVLSGNRGDDSLIGDLGNDMLLGGDGQDRLRGDDGDDLLRGDDGNDILSGGAGFDLLRGGTGNDTLAGGLGNDTLRGLEGSDQLLGEGGSDLLDGGDGTDVLNGGPNTLEPGIDRCLGPGAEIDLAFTFNIETLLA